jgi:hypothetical protein
MFHDVVELITSGAAIGALIMGVRNSNKIQAVHVDINSRMTQLLKATGTAAHAEGVEAGRNETR